MIRRTRRCASLRCCAKATTLSIICFNVNVGAFLVLSDIRLTVSVTSSVWLSFTKQSLWGNSSKELDSFEQAWDATIVSDGTSMRIYAWGSWGIPTRGICEYHTLVMVFPVETRRFLHILTITYSLKFGLVDKRDRSLARLNRLLRTKESIKRKSSLVFTSLSRCAVVFSLKSLLIVGFRQYTQTEICRHVACLGDQQKLPMRMPWRLPSYEQLRKLYVVTRIAFCVYEAGDIFGRKSLARVIELSVKYTESHKKDV